MFESILITASAIMIFATICLVADTIEANRNE